MATNVNNNFNLVRICLSLVVFFYHIFALTQNTQIAWFSGVFNADFAVKGFFAISGYLIMGSYSKSSSLSQYLSKRFNRIYPAYFAVIFFSFLLGIIFTSLNFTDYLTNVGTFKYLLYNLFFFNTLQPSLPGVFNFNRINVLNGSLWTIKIEVCLYLLLPIISYLYKKSNPYIITFAIYLLSVCWVIYFSMISNNVNSSAYSRQFVGQLSYFILGAFMNVNRNISAKIPYIILLILPVYLFLDKDIVRFSLQPIIYSLFVLYISVLPRFKYFNITKLGDISYGIYLFHFPIIQVLIHIKIFEYNVYLGIILATIITFFFAFISWNFIEKKFILK